MVFIATPSHDEINKLKQTLEKNFGLKFTTELNINKKKIPFQYVLTDSSNNNKFITFLYKNQPVPNLLYITIIAMPNQI